MQIPVNKNIDEYKEDFYKGLTLKQTILAVFTVMAGTAAFLFFYVVLHLGQTVSLYLALPAAFPFAASGFLQIHGKSPVQYLKARNRVKKQPLYRFVPKDLEESEQELENYLL